MSDGFPLLSLCLAWPLAGAVLLAFINHPLRARQVALAVALFELMLTLVVLWVFDSQYAGFQLQETSAWIPGLQIHFHLGVDGISVLFLPATALLTSMALLAGWNTVRHLSRFYLALMLVLEGVTIGVFTALDLTLFFLFWELTLPPLFFLIGLWGMGAERRYAAMKYVLYMLFGGVPLLFAFLLLAINHARLTGGVLPDDLVFSLPVLLDTPIATSDQGLILLLLMLGFAVKAPLPPFHTWLPTVAMEGPAQISALLMGLKLGLYGILRFAIPLAPSAALEHRWLLAICGAATLIYTGLIALRQTNMRRMLAYASVSHVGLVLIGVASFTLQGVQGAIMQCLNFSLIAGSLMLIAGMVQQRLGSNELVHLGGMVKPMPRMTVLFFLFALSSIGVPLTSGFPAEFMLFVGVLESFPALAMVCLLAMVLGAAYLLGFIRQGFLGPILQKQVASMQDLRPRELAILTIPGVMVLVLGCYPQMLIDYQQTTISYWLKRMSLPVTQIAYNGIGIKVASYGDSTYSFDSIQKCRQNGFNPPLCLGEKQKGLIPSHLIMLNGPLK